ncbi:hypothetical protein ILUMI_01752 [Ignelater luminosus]|uniref:Uncharacterized protein n=1 Tax=Ignelater luminosus TaxID=2038154 RepID=A0A8K0DJ14_IGNLU|nr:hypothetical protein ILUMI_01752 [Ignelater luminosus]
MPVICTYVRQLLSKLEETGYVANKKRAEPRILDEAMQIEVVGRFATTPTLSLRKASAATEICPEQIVQELAETDYYRRIQFCEEITKRIRTIPELKLVNASLSAIGNAISSMLKEEGRGNRVYLELLSDAGRLLSPWLRRKAACPNLNKDIRKTRNSSSSGKWLFGGDLGYRVEMIKILERSGQALKAFSARSRMVRKPLTVRSLK